GEAVRKILLERLEDIVDPSQRLDLRPDTGSFDGGINISRFIAAVEPAVFCVVPGVRLVVDPAVVMNAQMHRLRAIADVVAQNSAVPHRLLPSLVEIVRPLRSV